MNDQNQVLKDYRSRRKARIIYVMGGSCKCCGYNRSQKALELHHLNPNEKEFSISKWVVNWSETIVELAKCVLVCANCHREIHDGLLKIENVSSLNEERALEISKEIDNIKSVTQHFCQDCGAPISRWGTYCTECSHKKQRKVVRPSRDNLKNDIRTMPMLQVGKKYGVSDNTIRKWCIAENLPSKVKEIKAFTDDEWLKI